MEIFRLAGSAICHQATSRTLIASGQFLPLCARCAGIYLGMLCAVVYLALRGRLLAREFPSRAALFCLLVPVALTALDASPKLLGAPEYTCNTQRFALGSALGAAVVLSAAPAYVRLFCRAPRRGATVASAGEAALILAMSASISMCAALFGGKASTAAGCAGVCVALIFLALTNLAVITALLPAFSRKRAAVLIAASLTVVQVGVASAVRWSLLSTI
ncbi:MAG: DUF2085 domain-containing protein [Armatimonadota bacterium]|nr:DUF2085 domain-containing protein [Armatimonadota bacterium]